MQIWAMIFKRRKIMVFEILSFNLYLEEEKQLWTTVWMQAYHNEKMKELVYPPPNTLGQSDHQLRKKWWTIELKPANCFVKTENMLYCTQ